MSEAAHAWTLVVEFMRQRCGLRLRDDQRYLLAARLAPVARDLGYSCLHRFVAETTAPDAPAHAVHRLVDAMTTHETSFFRDPGFWDSFVRLVMPVLRARVSRAREASIWCGACSTGQEAYSVAMLLEEVAPEIAPAVRILATDVSVMVVERGRQGRFDALETARGLDARRLMRHFEASANGFQVRAALRARIDWGVHNLLGTMPYPSGCDVVFCRNVLIYFDASDRARAVERLFAAARPAGFVGVGSTEVLAARASAPGWYAVAQGVR